MTGSCNISVTDQCSEGSYHSANYELKTVYMEDYHFQIQVQEDSGQSQMRQSRVVEEIEKVTTTEKKTDEMIANH